MREHLGIDVDALNEDTLINGDPIIDKQVWDPDAEQDTDKENSTAHFKRPILGTCTDSTINGALGSTKQGKSSTFICYQLL